MSRSSTARSTRSACRADRQRARGARVRRPPGQRLRAASTASTPAERRRLRPRRRGAASSHSARRVPADLHELRPSAALARGRAAGGPAGAVPPPPLPPPSLARAHLGGARSSSPLRARRPSRPAPPPRDPMWPGCAACSPPPVAHGHPRARVARRRRLLIADLLTRGIAVSPATRMRPRRRRTRVRPRRAHRHPPVQRDAPGTHREPSIARGARPAPTCSPS